MKRKLTSLLLAAILLLCSGCSLMTSQPEEPLPPQPMTYSKAGLSITLTDEFTEKDYVTYTAVYESPRIAVFALKEEFRLFDSSVLSSESSTADYAGLLWKSNGFTDELPLTEQDGLTWFDYDRSVNGADYTYRVYAFKGSDSFWMVQFAAFADSFDGLAPVIHSYAKTVTAE